VAENMLVQKKLQYIKKKSSSASSKFASLWGQQNNPTIRKLPFDIKNLISPLVNDAVNSEFKFYKDQEDKLVERLQDDGILVLPNEVNANKIESIQTYFTNIDTCTAWHVPDNAKPKFNISDPQGNVQGSFNTSSILLNKELMDIFLNDKILNIVEGYLGAPGRLFHVNSMISFPSLTSGQAQTFHRDNSHVKFCVLFVYLTDVDLQSGPHEYFKHTHCKNAFRQNYCNLDASNFFDLPNDGYNCDQLYENLLLEKKSVISGVQGTCILTDPRGIHRGQPVKRGQRLIAWARYAVIPDDTEINKTLISLDELSDLSDRQLYTLSSIIDPHHCVVS
jgi:hypothetical protein